MTESRTPRKPRRSVPAATPSGRVTAVDDGAVPVVGVGASAGGLEALELFFESVAPGCGLAFVVVQHMDPNYKGMLVELLQRKTAMPVVQITDMMPVEPNHVYVMPPNRDVALASGVLHLSAPTEPRGLRLPIDFFLRSLADDLGRRCVGVILSGMGSDGTLGLRAIREHAGVGFVQEPTSAKFDGMPRSAIAAGVADVVAPAARLPERIDAFFRHVQGSPADVSVQQRPREDSDDLARVIALLRAQTGKDFSGYKKTTMLRRIERRMGLNELGSLADYGRFLSSDAGEAQLLFQEMLIGVTNFFRDPPVWDQLRDDVIPKLLALRPEGGVLRAWVAGCSTGEEAYSMAISFLEALELVKPDARFSLQIFATDVDPLAIDRARTGLYPPTIVADVGETRFRRFFVEDGDSVRVTKEVREMVIFAVQSVISDPPFTKLELLSCRNLLIYLEAGLQQRLIPLFSYSLNPGGLLLLGSAEAVGDASDLFTPLKGAGRFYATKAVARFPEQVDISAGISAGGAVVPSNSVAPVSQSTSATGAAPASVALQASADSLMLQRYAPAAVATDVFGEIMYVIGKAANYLEVPTGTANWNIFVMVRPGLSVAVRETFARSLSERRAVTSKSVLDATRGGGTVGVDITIEPLVTTDSTAPQTMLVVFADVIEATSSDRSGAPAAVSSGFGRATRAMLADELALVRAELDLCQAELRRCQQEHLFTRDEAHAARQELRSTSEEMQSANEELQSANEELNTSKEEMQSMNEELQTVNNELQARVQELAHANDDTMNLFNSTAVAALFLDDRLNVRRFTPTVTGIIRLIPGDVGRPLTDLVSTLDYPALADDIGEVLRTLIFHEEEVTAGEGRWFRVRIMPYRTQDNRIDGVVITFVDSSEAHLMQQTLRDALSVLEGRLTRQGAELEDVREFDEALRTAQALLEARFAEQTEQLRQSRLPIRVNRPNK